MFFDVVAGQGFEPRFSAPEADVLPLDDPAICTHQNSTYHLFFQ